MVALTITNPGAEAGDTSGWTLANGDDWSASTLNYTVSPRSGTYHFVANNARSPCEMYQEIDVSAYAASIDAGAAEVDASWWHCGNPARVSQEAAYVILSFRNSGGSQIGSAGGYGFGGNASYAERTLNAAIPANTRTIRLRLQAFDGDAINGTEVLADDISLELTVTGTELAGTSAGTGGGSIALNAATSLTGASAGTGGGSVALNAATSLVGASAGTGGGFVTLSTGSARRRAWTTIIH